MPMLDAGVLQFDVTIGDRGANFAKVEALLAAERQRGRSPGAGAARAVEHRLRPGAHRRAGHPGGEAEAAFLGAWPGNTACGSWEEASSPPCPEATRTAPR
jgi:hypothetical protein